MAALPVASGDLLQRPLAVLQLRSSGGNPLADTLLELVILQVDQGQVSARQSWSLTAGTPSLEQAEQWLHALRGRILVAHNLRLQLAFLRRALLATGLQLPRCRQLCTQRLSRQRAVQGDAQGAAGCGELARADEPLAGVEWVWQRLQVLLGQAGNDAQQLLREGGLPRGLQAAALRALPERPGVYYLYGEAGALLYVGKSRTLRQRVPQHFRRDHLSHRSLQLSQQVRELRVQVTAGELGALLLEALEVQRLQPLYNRQLRRQRQLLTWVLESDGEGLRPRLQPLTALMPGVRHAGLFASRRQALDWLRGEARQRRLCPRLLGLETGRGSCFAAQLGHCAGACCARESRAAHDARLLEAGAQRRIAAWPWAGPVALVERDSQHGLVQYHLLDQWRYLGSRESPAQLRKLLKEPAVPFSRDIYRILLGYLRRNPQAEVQPL